MPKLDLDRVCLRCALQFWGNRNTGRVARGLSKTGVVLHSCISEHDHGKAMPDGLANVATGAITEGVACGHHLEPGTRSHVLYLAQQHPTPRSASADRVGWAPGRYFYGYYDPSLWGDDEDFTMYKNAKQFHYRVGTAVEEEAVRDGLLKVRERICGCPQCAPPLCNFSGCVVKSIFGRVRSVHCPALKKVRGALTQTGALTEFSETLAADCVYAAKVAEDQAGVEGPYWLALLLTPSFETEVECVFAGDVIEAGFLVVKVILSNLLWLSVRIFLVR